MIYLLMVLICGGGGYSDNMQCEWKQAVAFNDKKSCEYVLYNNTGYGVRLGEDFVAARCVQKK